MVGNRLWGHNGPCASSPVAMGAQYTNTWITYAYNEMWDNGGGIMIQSADQGPRFMIGNIIYDCTGDPGTNPHFSHGITSRASNNPTYYLHNTIQNCVGAMSVVNGGQTRIHGNITGGGTLNLEVPLENSNNFTGDAQLDVNFVPQSGSPVIDAITTSDHPGYALWEARYGRSIKNDRPIDGDNSASAEWDIGAVEFGSSVGGGLRFTPANWDTAQTVTVTGVDDTIPDGDQTTAVTLSIDDANSDDAFDALADQTVSVTTTDDDGGLVAEGGASDSGNSTTTLSAAQLESAVNEAVARWTATGLSESERSGLNRTTFQIADLPDGEIGRSFNTEITIDTNAAGHGWFVDESPGDDQEFEISTADTERVARPSSDASTHMDLVTVVMHELGHVLGKDHTDAPSLMAEELPTGTRRLPVANNALDVDGNGQITSRDVLWIVNVINAYGSLANGALSELGVPHLHLDINRDGFVTSADVRLVVNEINYSSDSIATRGEAKENSVAVVPNTADANSINHRDRAQLFSLLAEMAATHGPLPRPSLVVGHATEGDDEGLAPVGLEDELLSLLADDWHRAT